MKFLISMLTMTLVFSTQAAVDASSFTGAFKTGDCTLSQSDRAKITFNGQSLIVKFEDQTISTEIFVKSFEEDFAVVKVTEESFSLTNEYFAKVNVGMLLPVMKTQIARSATGNRIHLSTLHYETNMKYECVLYRN